MPVQQPQKYHLALNLRTAAALKLKVPDWLRLEANEVVS
jgi:hypothetical protein